MPRLVYASAHATAQERREAVRLLGEYPSQAVHDPLLLALEDEDLSVRLEAAESLGRVRAAEAVPPLMDWLDDKRPDVRAQAVKTLGEIADARAVPGIARALSDNAAGVRLRAVIAIARQPAPEALPKLLASLDDGDSAVRLSAASALDTLADQSAFASLANHSHDEAPEVRAAVLRALGHLHDARSLPLLVEGQRDGDDTVALQATAALGDSNDAAAIPPLTAALSGDSDSAKTAVAALGRIGDARAEQLLIATLDKPALAPAAVSALLDRARRSDPSAVAVALTDALAKSQSASAVSQIADALRELAALTPIAAAKDALLAALTAGRGDPKTLTGALAATDAPELLDVLLEQLGRADAASLDAMLSALDRYFDAGFADGRAAEPLLARLGQAKGATRRTIERLIGESGAVRTLPQLTAALANAEPVERIVLVRAIGQLASANARAGLSALLDDADPDLRIEAAHALARTPDAALVRQLLAALQAEGPSDRGALVLALGESVSKMRRDPALDEALRSEVLASLRPLIVDRDETLAMRALDGLGALGDRRAIGAIARVLRSPLVRRRAAAVATLAAFPEEDTRKLLRFVLQHDGPRAGVSAALALGEVGDQRDANALVHAAARGSWPLPAAAAFGLARMAQRGAGKKHSLGHLLCQLAASTDPYARANVAVGMSALAAEPCEEADPIAWLAADQPPPLRVAAAGWLRALASGDTRDPRFERARLECSADLDRHVAEACRVAAPERTERAPRRLLAIARDGQSTLRDRLVALRLADRSVFVGYSDVNGDISLPAAVSGEVLLEDPADPAP